MHFPVNQLANCAALSPSPSHDYWLLKRISFSSQTQSRDHKPQKFAAPELTDLHVKLFFSFLFLQFHFFSLLQSIFRQFPLALPKSGENIIMRRSLWCVLYVRCTLWWRLHHQMETDKKLITITFIQSLQRLQHVQPAGLAPASSSTLSYTCPATAPCPTPCCVTLRRLRGRAPKLALIRDNH